MTTNLAPATVWQAIEKEFFAVLGMVTANEESRTSGIVYVVDDGQLYISVRKRAWKARHIANNPHISMTIPIHKRIPFLPWIKIPAATITFSGTGAIHDPAEVAPAIIHKLYQGREQEPGLLDNSVILSVSPHGNFITYGVGVSLMDMRSPDKARGKVAIA